MRTAFLIEAGSGQLIVEIDGKMHSLRRVLGVDRVEVLSPEDSLARVDNYITNAVPELVPVA